MMFREPRARIAWWLWSTLTRSGITIAGAYYHGFVSSRNWPWSAVARLEIAWISRVLRLCRAIDPYFR